MHWPSGFSMVASLTYIERPKGASRGCEQVDLKRDQVFRCTMVQQIVILWTFNFVCRLV